MIKENKPFFKINEKGKQNLRDNEKQLWLW